MKLRYVKKGMKVWFRPVVNGVRWKEGTVLDTFKHRTIEAVKVHYQPTKNSWDTLWVAAEEVTREEPVKQEPATVTPAPAAK